MTEYAKESKNIQRLRRKIKKRLKEETKTISKRTLKKISQLIHLKLERQKLDSVLTQSVEYARESSVIDVLRRKIHRDSKRLAKILKKKYPFDTLSSTLVVSRV